MYVLEVEELKVRYPGMERPACDISFCVEVGEMVGIAGASGAGKSTALMALAGIAPERAKVTYQKLVRNGTAAVVFQNASESLNPLVPVGRQLTETLRAHGIRTKKEAVCQAEALLEEVGIGSPKKRMKQYPFELSGGMKQRAAIAMALACSPALVIADEPTTALDVTVRRQILELLKRVAKKNHAAVLLVSHDLGVIASMCSRVLVMKDGSIVEEGDIREVFGAPRHPYTQRLVSLAENGGLPKEEAGGKEVILEARQLKKQFRERAFLGRTRYFEAVETASFHICRGETFGLVGESGSGKTTLARMLTGIMEPDGGSFSCGGKVQMIFQEPYASFDPGFSLERILEEPLLIRKACGKEERKRRAAQMLRLVGLGEADVSKRAAALSGGQQQRLAVARALLMEPEVLVCDEAFSAQDVLTQEQLAELLERIQAETGLSYLFISHDLDMVRRIAHRMGVMYRGSMVEQGRTAELCKDPWHPYTKKLLGSMLPISLKKTAGHGQTLLRDETEAFGEAGQGCPFAPKCSYAMECCRKEKPDNYRFGNREVRCFLYSEAHTGKRAEGYRMSSQI